MTSSKINKIIKENYRLSYDELAKLTGIKADSVRKRYNRMGLPAKKINVQNTDISDLNMSEKVERDQLVIRVLDQNREIGKKYKEALRKMNILESNIFKNKYMQDENSTFKIKTKKEKKNEAIPFLVFSDLHIEGTVDSETINNLNHYTLEIAKDRVSNFFKRGLENAKMIAKYKNVDTIGLALLGDFINNNIHEELLQINSLSPIDAMIQVQEVIMAGIDYILNNSKFDIVIPCVSSNHDRITKDRTFSTESGTSLDTFLYFNLSKYYENEKRIKFVVSKSYHLYLDVLGYTVRFHHGHNVRYSRAAGGLYGSFSKDIDAWNKTKYADYDIIGHYHSYKVGDNFMINGSVTGFNAYALAMKVTLDKPQQTFFVIERGLGRTFTTPIDLS